MCFVIWTARKKIAVLGDMFELGADSASYHYQIGEYLRDKKIDEVVVVGKEALEIKRHWMSATQSMQKHFHLWIMKKWHFI